MASLPRSISSFSFAVSGTVQGVHFRKCTKRYADAHGLTGWCENTSDFLRVVGAAEGEAAHGASFKTWLRETGSPKSIITGVVFSDEVEGAPVRAFKGFSIRR